ncbi:hypothetical protein BN7_5504 [Wickerhamomyces ciferrii]|uniref:Uncharacterized protein n=1 Tax=Wickerhamomyces ciferrii (strain ATCC 14091 / BCRC 22168 / CBS 111 / JCM 3599 / NBRC 0793 / NRRL Y-1031 F-60-10) TaxID=1206466 RepID=K0KVG9_WICCF|nr:uncharacterized protein BN7_5504 [Wickerhamomyces ciferrii]CCH45917.1 hypothetical protein BN7_5504 [Wickerhamomyces ciferrii]
MSNEFIVQTIKMVLHDVRDLKDIKKIRLTRPYQTEKVLVRLTMLVNAVKYGDQPSLDLTDYTQGYSESKILNFTVKTGSLASQHFKELKKAYPIVDNSTGKVLKGTKDKVQFYDNGYHVFLNVVAEAYNGLTELQLKVTEFKIINKQPAMILKMSLNQQAKLTSLVKLLEKRREDNLITTPKNEEEIKKIIAVIRKDDKPEEHQSKRQKPNEEEEKEAEKEEAPTQQSSDGTIFPTNPLFNPLPEEQQDEVPLTQMQNEIFQGSDDFDQLKSDNNIQSSQNHDSSNEGNLRVSNDQPQQILPKIEEEETDNEIQVKREPILNNRIKLEDSNVSLSQQLRDNNVEVITVLNDSGDDDSDSDSDIENVNGKDRTDHASTVTKDVQTSLTPTVQDNVQSQSDLSKTIEIAKDNQDNNNPEQTPNNNENGEEQPQQFNESDEVNYAKSQDGIASIMSRSIELGVPYSFTGFIIGIEPLNFKVLAKSFNDLIKITNFKLYISNIPYLNSNIFQINKNVICLEFRTKEQILSFFGYDDIELAFLEQDKIQAKLIKLLETRHRLEIDILRKVINLSVAQDYLDQGVEEEESGDRWIISDLSKSLRFYQKAYDYYIEAINKNDGLVDAYYNADRLLFHIWEVYHSIPLIILNNVDGCDVVNYPLREIKEKHEFVIKKFPQITWELKFNLILINLEIIEEFNENFKYEDLLKICDDCVGILEGVLDYQLKELDLFLKKLENPFEDQGDQDEQGGEQDDDDYEVMEQITPSSVLETVLTSYKLIETSLGNCENQIQINLLNENFKSFQIKLSEILELLFGKFNPDLNPENKYQLNFIQQEIQDIKLVIHTNEGFLINDYESLLTHWSNSERLKGLEQNSSRYLAEADSFQNFKGLLSSSPEGLNSELHWIIINQINLNLKKSQELIKLEMDTEILNKTAEVSSKNSKIIEVLILRADNELIRSSFKDLESSIKNHDILVQNAINLLKNGLNLSNANCGLRETIIDKFKKEKLKKECVLRLLLLTRDSITQDDLIRNIGINYYSKEVEDLQNVEIYKPLFSKVV